MHLIRVFARVLLILTLVGACAAPGTKPATSPMTGSSHEPVSPSGTDARPTADATATVAPTTGPTPTMPPFTFMPAGGPPAELQTRATATREGIRVSIELEFAPLRVGQAQTVTLTVRNVGTKGARWFTDGCGSPFDVLGNITSENWIGGVAQTGIAAEFKTEALQGKSGDAPLGIGFDDPRIPDGAGCADVGIGHTLAAGKSIRTVVRWTGDEVVAPDGPVELVASFRYGGHVGDPEDEPHPPVAVTLASWLVSGYTPDFVPPGPAIDFALRDPTFIDWLAQAPSSTWVNGYTNLSVENSTWEIGLFRDGRAGFYGSVTIDARTGAVLRHRFE